MGLFSFLKEFGQKDELADSLKKAIKDSGLRPAFYKKFLLSDVFVLIYGNDIASGLQSFDKNSASLIRLNDKKIPVFSSQKRIFDNGIIKEGVSFSAINGRELLKMTKGETLALNPYSKINKDLLPEEVSGILSGKMPGMNIEPIIIENKADVIIGLPAEKPKEMIESIKSYCKERAEVESVYLALFQMPESHERPHFIIAVEAAENLPEIFGDLTQVIMPHLEEDEFLDMTPLAGSSFEDFFGTIDPVYRK